MGVWVEDGYRLRFGQHRIALVSGRLRKSAETRFEEQFLRALPGGAQVASSLHSEQEEIGLLRRLDQLLKMRAGALEDCVRLAWSLDAVSDIAQKFWPLEAAPGEKLLPEERKRREELHFQLGRVCADLRKLYGTLESKE